MTEKIVRCPSKGPTPYLREILPKLVEWGLFDVWDCIGADLGCGNGRNTRHLQRFIKNHSKPDYNWQPHQMPLVLALDPEPPEHRFENTFSRPWHVGDEIPVIVPYDIILCQYILMFLTKEQTDLLARNVADISGRGSLLVVELENIKQGHMGYIGRFKRKLDEFTGSHWQWVHHTKMRGVLQRLTPNEDLYESESEAMSRKLLETETT